MRWIAAVLAALACSAAWAQDRVYYDYVEDGVLKGGWIDAADLCPPPAPGGVGVAATSTTIVNNGPSANRIDLVTVGDGYTAAQMATYYSHVTNVINLFFAQEPLNEYSTCFNVHRVDVASNESGVDNDPTSGISRDTALDAGFWCADIERLLCVNTNKAWSYAGSAPACEQVLVLVNSSKYGGAGYTNLATVAGANSSAVEVALHEFGHSFAKLGDEYDYGGSTTYTGGEPADPNASIYQSAQWRPAPRSGTAGWAAAA